MRLSIFNYSLLGALFLSVFACQEKKQTPPPPTGVTVTKVIQKDVPIYQEFVGQTYGIKDIPIRARVNGFLKSINFKEGNTVKKGQLLYTVDQQPFLANVGTQKGLLAEKKTQLVRAQNDLERIRPLAERKAVSQSDLDAAIADEGAARASVEAAQSNLDLANIELGYCNIYSPIDGVIGRTEAREGEFVGKSPNPVILNTVSRIETIRVQFSLTESDYLIVMRELVKDRKMGSNTRNKEKNLDLILSDGSVHNHKGELNFIDREVNSNTGSIMIQASFPNPEGILRPGQFAKVRAEIERVKNAILIPQKAVYELQGKFSVTVLKEDNTVEKIDVTVGSKYGDYWIIKDGIKPTDKVVYEGFQKVRNGMKVTPSMKEFESQTDVLEKK